MMLADHGAEVIRIERPGPQRIASSRDPLLRSRRTLTLDLKQPAAIAAVRRIAGRCDGLIEGFRPGVMERLGLGPETLLRDTPRLVYGRMTGWGQTGPMAHDPGHDINYIAISGALHAFGRQGEKPTPPINMMGDFGGGGMMLAFGMVCAILHAQRTGEGQVVDAAMSDGSATLMSMIWGMRGNGLWSGGRGGNMLDTGAHYYDTYETADGKWVSLGAIEPQFYAALRGVMALDDPCWDAQHDPAGWPALKRALADRFRARTRDEWVAAFAGHDVCFAPVLDFDEAVADPHNVDRGVFVEVGGIVQPVPAPRYSASRTVMPVTANPADGPALLDELGFGAEEIAALGVS